MITPARILETLTRRNPSLLPRKSEALAAVALILRAGASGPEVLFIERAHHDDDPWSGNLGFPGGRLETNDSGPREAAERETREEIGLDLKKADYLGRLDDTTTASLPVLVSCFVYQLNEPADLRTNHEVRSTHWIPFQKLMDPRRRMESTVRFGGRKLVRPAMDVLGPGGVVLWGLTYRLVLHFLEVLDGEI